MASLISSTIWVQRGVAAQFPRRYNLDENELERVTKMAGSRLEQVKQELAEAQQVEEEKVDVEEMIKGDSDEEEDKKEGEEGDNDWTDEESSNENMDIDMADGSEEKKVDKITDDLAQYNLDNYDEEKSKSVSTGVFSNVKGLQYYDNPHEDPYVTLQDLAEDEDIEREELEIYPTDSILVTAKTQDDVSQLDIYVYDESEENLYVHHDLLLPAMPLCLEWINFTPAGIHTDDPNRKGNFVAVGTMDPEIELWNLDVIDGLYPDGILGGTSGQKEGEDVETGDLELESTQSNSVDASSKKKKKKKKKKSVASSNPTPTNSISATHHTSSVLSLSHNRTVRNFLLSSSADTTVKLWDLNVQPIAPSSTFTAIRSFDLHQDKVQSVQWNSKQPTMVLSGGWDRMIKVWDTRNCMEGVGVKVESDVECLRWDPFEDYGLLVTLDNGLIQSYDSRMLPTFDTKLSNAQNRTKALWTLSAHDSSVSALDISSTIPGLMVTGGVDKMVKVWNVDKKDGKPTVSMVTSRDLGVGKVFSVSFCPDAPGTIAVAGSKALVQIWDLTTNNGVRSVFHDRLKKHANFNFDEKRTVGNGGVIGLTDEPDSDED